MGLVLHGILNMPYPDDPAQLDVVTWAQAKSAMREASAEIEHLRGLLNKHGINPDAEYICRCGRRWESGKPVFEENGF